MIHHSVVQGSEAWLRMRMGMPTASEFERIIQPKKWEPTKSETREKYLHYILTELLMDTPLSDVSSAAMQHGNDWEKKALAAYEMMKGIDTEPCGFCTNDEGTIGASPDFFVGEDGSGEIKSPFKPEIHVGYMFNNSLLVNEYFVQTQGQLYITGRQWTDLISAFGGMPLVIVRITPHLEFQVKLAAALRGFVAEVAALIKIAEEKGWLDLSTRKPATRAPLKDDEGGTLGVSQDDITQQMIASIIKVRKEREAGQSG